MLTRVTDDGWLHWECLLYDEDGMLLSCGEPRVAHIEQVRYVQGKEAEGTGGATLMLPACACGVQTFLKADYSLAELWKCTLTVKNDEGVIWAYALKMAHVRNLRAHHLLYERGLCQAAPLLTLPPGVVRARFTAAGVADPDVMCSLWFGLSAVHKRTASLGAAPRPLLLPAP